MSVTARDRVEWMGGGVGGIGILITNDINSGVCDKAES